MFYRFFKQTVQVTWEQINVNYSNNTVATVRDLWDHKDLGSIQGSFEVKLDKYAVSLLKVQFPS